MGMWKLVLIACSALALGAAEDPLQAPPELQAFARQVTLSANSRTQKLQMLVASIHRPVEEGGLGIQYDNAYTRSVSETWHDRKANCLSLTALYVACARSLGFKADYADAQNTPRWRRVGSVVRFERHVVALIQEPPYTDLVADFLPQLRKRWGRYVVTVLPEHRMQALFRSNRAVELMDGGDLDAALKQVEEAIALDPKSSIGWNTRGVVMRKMGRNGEAEVSFRRALTEDPRDISPIGNMEGLLLEQGRAEEATIFRLKGVELRQRDPYFHAFLAEEALTAGHLTEAEKAIRASIKLLKFEPDFHLTLARIQIQQGELQAAVKSIEEARRWATPGERERYDSKLTILKGQVARPSR